MVAAAYSYQTLHNALLQGLGLSQADLAASAASLHACAAAVLTLEASKIAQGQSNSSSNASSDDDISNKTRRAALAVFHKLSSLSNGIPITIVSLHDFIIVFTSPRSSSSADETRLARRIVDTLFRKKPSLVRALENQLLPSWVAVMTSFAPTGQESWLQEATALFASISALSKINAVQECLLAASTSTAFWNALQSFYDISLPKYFSASIGTRVQSIPQIAALKEYARLRKDIVDFFHSFFPALSAEAVSQCLENEASNPELPSTLTNLPLTSLVNMTLLQDAEYYHSISRRVGLRSPASSNISAEERSYLQNALDFGRTIARDSICDVLLSMSKGKGKAVSNGQDQEETTSNKVSRVVLCSSEVCKGSPDESSSNKGRADDSAGPEHSARCSCRRRSSALDECCT